ncbi:LmbE family N-acetylglucosaminyl deacetylase [Pedobacter sp. AK017]|uniref:PIG-L deacetylase family protein n=1 Tax=Pedobacter sp. AK017 TaxID=2723073 RepID=UPI00161D10EE|nr:PIG-L deacetylase family protein [Pedobacter sp. AK017]MBB5438934.1 LmbE family N-acetylglucosaminyl deacetylase [Pedobacter sp. AK017]
MNIICIAAHPDDTELQCAGTLARYAKEGHNVTIAVFTDGSMGDLVIKPAELTAMRKQEAKNAADVIGAHFIWGGIVDEHVFTDLESRRRMIDILREADPDVIFTHAPNDYHPDHKYVSQLVFDSYFQKGLPSMPNQNLPACRFGQSQLYYMDNLCGIGFNPTEYVDITETFETKKEMLACHISQAAAFEDMANTDMMAMIEIQSRFRGLAAGCKYAEGFTRVDAYQRGLTRRILP